MRGSSLEILTHVRFVAGQKRELRGAQQVLRSMFDGLRGAKAFDERAGFPVGPQKGKIFECGVEIRIFLLLAPLQFWLAHGPALPFSSLPLGRSLALPQYSDTCIFSRPTFMGSCIHKFGDEGVFDGQAPCREALSLRSCGRSMSLALLI
jgi:hypothetical protein